MTFVTFDVALQFISGHTNIIQSLCFRRLPLKNRYKSHHAARLPYGTLRHLFYTTSLYPLFVDPQMPIYSRLVMLVRCVCNICLISCRLYCSTSDIAPVFELIDLPSSRPGRTK